MPNALQSRASPAASGPGLSSIFEGWNIFAPGSGSSSSGLSGLLNLISGSNNSAYGQLLNADIWNTIFSSGFYMPGNYLGTAADYMGLAGGKPPNRPSEISPKTHSAPRCPAHWAPSQVLATP
jgi:hypothetical protein